MGHPKGRPLPPEGGRGPVISVLVQVFKSFYPFRITNSGKFEYGIHEPQMTGNGCEKSCEPERNGVKICSPGSEDRVFNTYKELLIRGELKYSKIYDNPKTFIELRIIPKKPYEEPNSKVWVFRLYPNVNVPHFNPFLEIKLRYR